MEKAFLMLFSILICGCTGSRRYAPEDGERGKRISNLKRAAALPWVDDGRCVVQEASNAWPVLVERCFPALDIQKIRFRDPTGRCAVASVGAAATVGLGICILAAPEIAAGAVIIVGVVAVAVLIKKTLEHETAQTAPVTAGQIYDRPAEKTCDDATYDTLRGALQRLCKDAGEMSCGKSSLGRKKYAELQCTEAQQRLSRQTACLEARLDIQKKCFDSTDDRHLTPIEQHINGVENCKKAVGEKC